MKPLNLCEFRVLRGKFSTFVMLKTVKMLYSKRDLFKSKPDLFYIKSDLFKIKLDLFKIKLDLFEIKRDLFKIKRDLFKIKRDLFEIKRDLFYIKADLFKIKRDLFKINRDLFYNKPDWRYSLTTKLQRYFWIVLLALLAACGKQTVALPTEASTPKIVLPTLFPTSTLIPVNISPTLLPTQLTVPVPLDPFQVEQQKQIKNIIQTYFDLRYQALSVSPPENFLVNGFGDLVSDGPAAKDFLVTEMAKLAAERKWRELNGFRYVKYEYPLKYKSIFIDAANQIATISVLEDFTTVDERDLELNPVAPNTTRGDQIHEIVLHNEQGQWKIISDIYRDTWWLQFREPGMSTDEILRKINEVLQRLEAMPTATPKP
jgi:hypothetical protein